LQEIPGKIAGKQQETQRTNIKCKKLIFRYLAFNFPANYRWKRGFIAKTGIFFFIFAINDVWHLRGCCFILFLFSLFTFYFALSTVPCKDKLQVVFFKEENVFSTTKPLKRL
jgi:hypothetical protein